MLGVGNVEDISEEHPAIPVAEQGDPFGAAPSGSPPLHALLKKFVPILARRREPLLRPVAEASVLLPEPPGGLAARSVGVQAKGDLPDVQVISE